VEIYQESDIQIAQPKIREHLRFIDWQHGIHRFQLQKEHVFDYHVNSVAAFQSYAFVNYRQRHLTRNMQPACSKLISEALLIGRLKQPRPECSVYFNGASNYLLA